MPIKLGHLAEQIGATLHGDAETIVTGCAPIEQAEPHEITFLANLKYARHLQSTRAAAVLVNKQAAVPDHIGRLVVDDPYFAFRNALIILHGHREHPPAMAPLIASEAATISERAAIHPEANIGCGATVHPNVTIERGAVIGERCVLYPGVYIGMEAKLGNDCVLYPNVTVYERCILGDRVALHASTVIGHDGFGYATHAGEHHKIPQAGIVVIEDDVELGAGCAIERAAMGETRIGKGTKFADLISIGHNTSIGAHCLLVSLVGISGSVEVGDYVALGGQAGVTGHLKIGNGVQVMARSAIVRDVPDGQKVGGIPAVDADLAKRNTLASLELYELSKRVRRLERELKQIRCGPESAESEPKP